MSAPVAAIVSTEKLTNSFLYGPIILKMIGTLGNLRSGNPQLQADGSTVGPVLWSCLIPPCTNFWDLPQCW